jgi:hypothetical protein
LAARPVTVVRAIGNGVGEIMAALGDATDVSLGCNTRG